MQPSPESSNSFVSCAGSLADSALSRERGKWLRPVQRRSRNVQRNRMRTPAYESDMESHKCPTIEAGINREPSAALWRLVKLGHRLTDNELEEVR